MNRTNFIKKFKDDIELSEKARNKTIRNSVKKRPWKVNCTIAMEEFAELQQQVSKQIRGYGDRMGLLEEMADSYICLNLLKIIFDFSDEEIRRAIDVKLDRERRR